MAPAVWGVAVDPSTFPGIATDGVSEIFIVESAQTKTSLLLASCSDATFGGIAKHDLLLVRLGPDGTCLWSRWLAKDASALPNDDGPHRIAATANMVVVRMASSLVGLHDDGTMAWTVPFDADFFPDVLASESDFIVFSTGPTVIVLQHLSTAGALGPKLTFALADAAGAANVDVAVAADGTAVIHGNTDVAIPDLGVPAPPPNFDTVFAAALSPSGSVTWTKTFPDHTNLGGEELETAVLLAGDKVWVATLAPDPSDGNTLWIRAADGSWTSTDYPHVYLGPFAALPDGTLVVAAALPQQAVVAPLTGCAWLDTIGPLPPQGDVDTLLRLGNDLLVSGFFWTGSLSAQPPCGGPTSIDFAGRTFSAACSGRFLARVSP